MQIKDTIKQDPTDKAFEKGKKLEELRVEGGLTRNV